jgi:hypothetical protein
MCFSFVLSQGNGGRQLRFPAKTFADPMGSLALDPQWQGEAAEGSAKISHYNRFRIRPSGTLG